MMEGCSAITHARAEHLKHATDDPDSLAPMLGSFCCSDESPVSLAGSMHIGDHGIPFQYRCWAVLSFVMLRRMRRYFESLTSANEPIDERQQ